LINLILIHFSALGTTAALESYLVSKLITTSSFLSQHLMLWTSGVGARESKGFCRKSGKITGKLDKIP